MQRQLKDDDGVHNTFIQMHHEEISSLVDNILAFLQTSRYAHSIVCICQDLKEPLHHDVFKRSQLTFM
jgi:hypothetical protein